MENRLARTYIPEFGCTLRQGILQVRIYLKTVQVRIVLVKNHPKLHISKQKKVILQTHYQKSQKYIQSIPDVDKVFCTNF